MFEVDVKKKWWSTLYYSSICYSTLLDCNVLNSALQYSTVHYSESSTALNTMSTFQTPIHCSNCMMYEDLVQ